MQNANKFHPAHVCAALWKPVLAISGLLALAACATVPKPLTGVYAPLPPSQAAQGGADGTQVRWGGEIIQTQPKAHKTCFYVLSRPLDSTARPQADGPSHGRFVACHAGFYDPEVFTKGSEVTFTGAVSGVIPRMVGKYEYDYPRLQADTVYLWPERPQIVHRYRDPFYDPFWGPIGPWYNPFWHQPRRVIIVNRPPPSSGDKK